jgi:hypothetical protein
MPRAITTCPNCGASVTNYAVGCAVCGADIETARRAGASRRNVPAASLPTVDDDVFKFLVALLLALAAPVFGLAICAWFGYEAHRDGRTGMRLAMIVLAAVAALPLVTGYSLWGGFLTAL